MKQFYETYCDYEKLSPVVREIRQMNKLRELTELALENSEGGEE